MNQLLFFAAIVKSMTGSLDRVTNSVYINRIPVLYGRILAPLINFDPAKLDFIKKVCDYVYCIYHLIAIIMD